MAVDITIEEVGRGRVVLPATAGLLPAAGLSAGRALLLSSP